MLWGHIMKNLIVAISIIFGNYCFSGTIDPNVSDSKYIQYGQKHECVVKLHCISNKYGYGSAVLISPNIAITAAHMVYDIKEAYISHNDKKISIDIIMFKSEYLDDIKNKKMSPNDIAICHLTEKINIDFYPKLYKKHDEIGKTCSICGFGITGKYNIGASLIDDNKRAGSNIIDGITNGMLECSVNGNKKTSLEFLISSGDSGGGLFIDQQLAGINSLIYTDNNDKKLNSDHNDISCHTRISDHINWINNVLTIYKN